MFGTRRKQIEALEREVISNPTPQNMVALVERLIAAGQEDRALDFARKAVDRFPDSEQCNAVYQNVRRVQLQSQIQDLNRELRRNPTAAHYEQLSNLYLWDLGNLNKAFEIAMEGLTKFPKSDGLHLICGHIRMTRFHHDFLANDFNEAVRHFREAAAANPGSLKAHVNMGRLLAEIGAYKEAKESVERTLAIDADNLEIKQVGAIVEEHMAESVEYLDDALEQVERQRRLSPVGREIRKIFEPRPRGGTILEVSPTKIEQFLQGYESINGYKCSAVLALDGSFVAGHTRGDVPRDRFVRVAQAMLANALDSSKKMDTGAFVSSEVETPIGRIVMAVWKNLVLAILADAPAKKEDLDEAKERFVGFAVVQAPRSE